MNGFFDILMEYKKTKEFMNKTNDVVNHPSHYTGSIECIDAMIQQFGIEAVKSFCLCNAFKYLFRCTKKHNTPIEDIKKAQWYINKYLELNEKEGTK